MTPQSISRRPPSLAIVGASTRSAAASAVRAGFQPIAADLFADADLRRIATATRISPYPDGLVDWLRAVEPPAWMYTGAIENHPDLVDQMAWIAPLWGNPGDVLSRVRSPWELSRVLSEVGLLFPETRSSADGLPCDGTWLVKTYQGASGSGVRAWGWGLGAGGWDKTRRQGDKETRREIGIEHPTESPCLPLSLSPPLFPLPLVFQKRIAGTPCGATFVAADGTARLLGVTRVLVGEEWLGAHGFQYAGSIGPWPISNHTRATLERLGHVLAEEFELIGLFGVDTIVAEDDVWTLEVNPRYTASVEIVERFSGVNAIALHAAACGSQLNSQRAGASSPPADTNNHLSGGGGDAPARTQSIAFGKAILYARREIEVSPPFFEKAMIAATDLPWPSMADISAVGTPIEAGRPICTLFAAGVSVEEVEQQLRHQADILEVELYS